MCPKDILNNNYSTYNHTCADAFLEKTNTVKVEREQVLLEQN